MSESVVDLIIIGAGPAGISAALGASAQGVEVLLLDEQGSPGGQIYRNVAQADPRSRKILGADYAAGLELVEALLASNVCYQPRAAVWQVTEERRVHFLLGGAAHVVTGRQVLIATGAMERPMPIPGWTLPGVMTAGAGQILLKTAAMVPRGPVLLAGCGPLLYLLAMQYLRAGIRIEALVDTNARHQALNHWRLLPAALGGWRELFKGLSLLANLKRAGLRHFHSARHLRVRGEQRAESLCFESEGQAQEIQASLVLLHQGVVPDTQISRLLRAEHDWNEEQLCWVAKRDSWGETSLPGIFIAGDGGIIGGANVARTQGQLAALCIAHRLRRIDDLQWRSLAGPWLQLLRRQRATRPLIDALYRPQSQNRIADNETIVCRCEEVSAGAIRDSVNLGCLGPDQTKAFSRCGMGPCQGRQCGLSVSEIIAQQRGVVPAEVGYYRVRPPLKPITLAQLAGEREFDLSVFPNLERSRHEHRPNWYRK